MPGGSTGSRMDVLFAYSPELHKDLAPSCTPGVGTGTRRVLGVTQLAVRHQGTAPTHAELSVMSWARFRTGHMRRRSLYKCCLRFSKLPDVAASCGTLVLAFLVTGIDWKRDNDCKNGTEYSLDFSGISHLPAALLLPCPTITWSSERKNSGTFNRKPGSIFRVPEWPPRCLKEDRSIYPSGK